MLKRGGIYENKKHIGSEDSIDGDLTHRFLEREKQMIVRALC